MYLEATMSKKATPKFEMIECSCCKALMPKLRLELYGYDFCVECSAVGRKKGLSIQVGEGDHALTEVVILEEKEYREYMFSENKMRKKSTGKSKSEFVHFDDEDDKFDSTKFDDSEE